MTARKNGSGMDGKTATGRALASTVAAMFMCMTCCAWPADQYARSDLGRPDIVLGGTDISSPPMQRQTAIKPAPLQQQRLAQAGHVIGITQNGNSNAITAFQSGEKNSANAHQSGDDNQARLNQTGQHNDIDLSQAGIGNAALIVEAGTNTHTSVTQTGNGNAVEMQLNGHKKVIAVQQSGNNMASKVILY